MNMKTDGYPAGKHGRRIWSGAVLVLACAVVLITSYLLILPAITLEKTPVCGMEEHVHTRDCYQKIESRVSLVCEIPEIEGHQHTEDCYDEAGELICGKPEIEPHTHTEDCYDEAGVLVCGKTEVLEHVHSEECFREENVENELTCGLDEDENHTHTELCYGTWQLVCGLVEHTHTDSCWEADVESAGGEAVLSDERQSQDDEEDYIGDYIEDYGIAPLAVLPEEVVTGGVIEGTDLTWTLTKNSAGEYTLTLSGEGEIPNYEPRTAPWNDYIARDRQNLKVNLVIEEGITKIGNYAFYYSNLSGLSLPDTLTEICTGAFSSCTMTSVDIPSSVEKLGAQSFAYCSGLSSIVLPEGVKSMDGTAFGWGNLKELHLPSTLETINAGLRGISENITVEEGNECFKVVNGVLFQLNAAKTEWTLTAYPTNLPGESYTIPGAIDEKPVTAIAGAAFFSVKQLLDLTIPESVTTVGGWSFQSSSVQEVRLESTTLRSSSYAFIGTANLRELDISNLTGVIPSGFLSGSYLPSITIPEGITKIEKDAFLNCSRLTGVVYDARNADLSAAIMGTADLPRFDLTIGKNVDVLNAGFSQIAKRANSLRFTGPARITVMDGALAGAPEPFSTLSGNIYVDEQGLIYTYDEDVKTASLFYCPPGITSAVIPAAITPEEGVSCAVTAVGQNALKYANRLTSITFDAPGSVTSLDAYALADCPTLTSVNGKTTVEDAGNSFPNAAIGYNVFYNTGLQGAGTPGSFESKMDGVKSLDIKKAGATDLNINVSSSGNTMKWTPADAEAGGYRLLTGDTLKVTASVGKTEDHSNTVYRVYLRLTGDEGSLSAVPGTTYEFNDQEVTCYATEDPYTVYLEFAPQDGATMSFPITAVYPSPGSAGGGLTVWGCVLTPEEAENHENQLLESESGTIQAYWATEPDEFELTKVSQGAPNLSVVSDGAGGAKPNSNLAWQIKLNRKTATVSSYGKDYVRSADFTDTMTLPAGVSWNDSVKEAIQSGDVRWSGNDLYAGDVKIASLALASGSSHYCSGQQVNWDNENNTAVLRWQLISSTETAEMNASTMNVTIYADALSVDMGVFNPDVKSMITNVADAAVHYHYSEDKALQDTAEKTITGGKGSIAVTKTGTDVQYFGEDITYTVDVCNNGGLSWSGNAGVYTLSDPLSEYIWISPENMEKMFEGEYGDDLTITINNASLGSWQPVTGTDGVADSSWQHPGNSDLNSKVNVAALTITKTGDGGYKAEVTDGQTYTGSTVAAALRQAGFGVISTTSYTCVWNLNGKTETFTLEGGEHRLFKIYATVKDTFKILKSDWANEYPSDSSLTITNTATVSDPNDKKVKDFTYNKTVVRSESNINKSVYKNGQQLSGSPTAEDGDVLEYRLDFTHYGSGAYQDLPMVDDLYGSQYLLVPKTLNPQLDKDGLDAYNDYYILKEGTYQNVVVGVDDEGNSLTAASVIVGLATEEIQVSGLEYKYTGLHTQINWYFPELEGGNYRSTVTYQALVDIALSGANYTIGNIVWMNDRAGARIYDAVWGGGTIIDYQKDIVTERGESPAQDVLDEDRYSLIKEGDKVTYRLRLENSENGSFQLNGKYLADALPDTLSVFTWKKDINITDFEAVIVGENVTAEGLDNWVVGNRYLSLLGKRQYILWPDASITFNGPGTVYLYFTLTYPEDTESGAVWSSYAEALGGRSIDNTMYVYLYPSNVIHDLMEGGQALLQKGVYGMYYYKDSNSFLYTEAGNSRLFYNNRDSKYRAVAYYVTLYNDGNKRLYLNDLYDKLPDGFTYRQLLNNGNLSDPVPKLQTSSVITVGGESQGDYPLTAWSDRGGVMTVYRSANIVATKTSDGVRFSISAGTGDYALKYDEERQQYYLNKGEAIVFGYLCDIGTSDLTNNSATNAIAMPYTDQPETGVMVINKESLPITGSDSERFTDYNDGNRMTMNAGQVLADYGFESEENNTWLVSDVTVRRGGIIPGVTKYAESYVSYDNYLKQSSVATDYKDAVGPHDVVNWRVRLHNSGSMSMTDYTFTDIMPAPYVIVGPVTFNIYDGDGSPMYEQTQTACSFPVGQNGSEESIVVSCTGSTTGSMTVVFNGEEYAVWPKTKGLYLALSRDESGNEIMKLRFEAAGLAIPEGGYVDIYFSSLNPTNTFSNTVYTNQALLTPNRQEFTTVQQGSMVKDEKGKPVSAENSTPITVSFGHNTSSEKRVTENANKENTAVSTDQENNVILLSGPDSEFIYTLTVINSTDLAMTKLIIIDGLPEPGDHSPFHRAALRGSEFKVSLADEPEFTVTVTKTTDEGEVSYSLDEDYYKIEYTTGNDFGGPESSDWKGESTGTTAEWAESLMSLSGEDARAFRLIITDESGTQIPAGSRISVSFHAEADSRAVPGGVAWNNFGYHYKLKNVDTELESMPLSVGVQIPSTPALEKQLVDSSGQPVSAPKDCSFSFLVYEGEALTGYDSAEKLIEALEDADRDYSQFIVGVEAGKSSSGEVILMADGWSWTPGKKYTVVELPTDDLYAFRSFYGSSTASYTFTYDDAEKQVIRCENTFQQWKISLTKANGNDQPLSGAVFALYSPEENDGQKGSGEYSDFDIGDTVELSGQTWYLVSVAVSDENGVLGWEKLLRENYYLLEVKAPEGYRLNNPAGQILYRDGATNGVYTLTVVNHANHELPESGGTGTAKIYIGSLLVITLACFLLYRRIKRGKEDFASS